MNYFLTNHYILQVEIKKAANAFTFTAFMLFILIY